MMRTYRGGCVILDYIEKATEREKKENKKKKGGKEEKKRTGNAMLRLCKKKRMLKHDGRK